MPPAFTSVTIKKKNFKTPLQMLAPRWAIIYRSTRAPQRADIAKQVMSHRDQIRQRVVSFLTPDQLKMWDAEVAKAKEFLGRTWRRKRTR